MARERLIRWVPWEGPGLEHARVTFLDDGGLLVWSVVAGEVDGQPFGLSYILNLRTDWTVRLLTVSPAGGDVSVSLHWTGSVWHDHVAGEDRPDLGDCPDIDLRVTPTTNTLPIRRLRLRQGESREISVAYLEPSGFVAQPMRQRYTRLADRLYRFEALHNGFIADLPVDEDGFVLDYPGLFRRID